MYRTILVPTDGSDHAEAAAERAVDLAGELGAYNHALYVVDTSGLMSAPDVSPAMLRDALEDAGEAALESIEEIAAAGNVDCTAVLREGVPHRTILEYADETGADLLVMGTHGRSGLDRLLLGSVTEKIVRTAPVPVLTIRPDEDE